MNNWTHLRSQFNEITKKNAASIDTNSIEWKELGEIQTRLASSRFRRGMSTDNEDSLTEEENLARIRPATTLDTKLRTGIRQNDRNAIKRWFGGSDAIKSASDKAIHEAVYKTGYTEEQSWFYNNARRTDASYTDEQHGETNTSVETTRLEAAQIWRSRITHQNLQALTDSSETQSDIKVSGAKEPRRSQDEPAPMPAWLLSLSDSTESVRATTAEHWLALMPENLIDCGES